MEICSQLMSFISIAERQQDEEILVTPDSPYLCPCEVPLETLMAIEHFQLEPTSPEPQTARSRAQRRRKIRKLSKRLRKGSRGTQEDSLHLYQHLFWKQFSHPNTDIHTYKFTTSQLIILPTVVGLEITAKLCKVFIWKFLEYFSLRLSIFWKILMLFQRKLHKGHDRT